MHGAVLLDEAGEVLRPAILWNDQRTGAECDVIRFAVGPERLISITGNDALTGFTAPKLVWVRDHEPDVWGRIAHVLLPKDYLRFRLTGDYSLDKADGSGTILFDLAARDWSREVLDALEIDPGWMPPTYEGPTVTGSITAGAAAATGLRAGTPGRRRRWRPGGERRRGRGGRGRDRRAVARDVGRDLRDDEPAAVRGRRPGPRLLPRGAGPLAHDVGDALGGGQPAVVSGRACPGHGVLGSRGAGGGCAGGQRRPGLPPLPHRRTQPASRSAGPWRLRWPDGRPRPTPHDASGPRGCRVRTPRRARPDDRRRDAGAEPDPGLGWRDRERAVASDPGRRPRGGDRDRNTSEGAAYGAGLLAAVGAGWYPSVEAAATELVRATPVASPGPDAARYDDALEVYRGLYPALAPTFHRS